MRVVGVKRTRNEPVSAWSLRKVQYNIGAREQEQEERPHFDEAPTTVEIKRKKNNNTEKSKVISHLIYSRWLI